MTYEVSFVIQAIRPYFPDVTDAVLLVALGDTLVEIKRKSFQVTNEQPKCAPEIVCCGDDRYKGTLFDLQYAHRMPCAVDAVLYDKHLDLLISGMNYRVASMPNSPTYSIQNAQTHKVTFLSTLNEAVINDYIEINARAWF